MFKIPHIYYYVPPCPRCGSRKTGRYVKTPYSGAGYMKEHSLKNGELIRFCLEEPIDNGFCASCGFEWPVRVETRFLPYQKIMEEQKVRGTQDAYEEILTRKTAGESKWNIGKKLRERHSVSHENAAKVEETPQPQELEPEIIDRRKRDCIELLYADEELMRQVREVQNV